MARISRIKNRATAAIATSVAKNNVPALSSGITPPHITTSGETESKAEVMVRMSCQRLMGALTRATSAVTATKEKRILLRRLEK